MQTRSTLLRRNPPKLGLALLVLLSVCPLGRAAEPATVPPAQNAVELYAQAFAALPSGPDALAIRKVPEEGPLDAAALALASKYEPAAKLLRQAAYVPKCDWEVDYTEGPALALPFLAASQRSAELSAFRSRALAQNNKIPEAFDEIGAALVLGRRIGVAPLIICKLMEAGTTMLECEAAAKQLVAASPEAVQRLNGWLAAMPTALSPAAALETDGINISKWLAKPDNKAVDKILETASTLAQRGTDEARKARAASALQEWADPAKHQMVIDQVRGIAAAGGKVLSVPAKDVPAAVETWQKTVDAAGPVAQMMAAGSPARLRQVAESGDITLAMLRTAIAIKLKGPEALAASKDPAGDGPFTREDGPNGSYILKSKLESKNGPITLQVGG